MRTITVLCAIAAACYGQSGKIQKPGEIQKVRGTWQTPGAIQEPGDIQKIKEKCASRLLVGSDALFAFNQADLTPDAEKILSALGPRIQQEGKHPVVIEGHTDSIGSAAYNQELSEKRARAVQTWLTAHDFVASSASVRGYGKSKPVAPNAKPDGTDNPEGRQKNRRVEIVIDTCK